MEKKLGQNDIDALFAAMNSSSPETAEGTEANRPGPEQYGFSRAGRLSGDQMRAISTVNDLFARNLMHSMSAWLRTPFRAKLVSGEQLPFAEFLERLSSPTYMCSVRLEPLGAVGLIELDLAVTMPMVDVLLGGSGQPMPKRELTQIEESIMTSVMELVVQELTLAWQPVGLEFAIERRETEAQAARMMTLGEKTLCVSFEMKTANTQGVLNLCLPAVVLNAILHRLITEGDRPRRRSKDAAARMRELMAGAKAGVTLQLPAMRLKASEIAAFEAGVVLRLPMARHECSELRIGQLLYAAARPVRSGEHRGARLEGEAESVLVEMPADGAQSKTHSKAQMSLLQ